MITSKRRAAGGPAFRLARAVAFGSLLGTLASWVSACGRTSPARVDGEADSAAGAIVQSGRPSPATPPGASVPMLRGECTECHPRAHDAVLGRGPTVSLNCATCHARTHEQVHQLYAAAPSRAGLRADPMFDARVECAGCHDDSTFTRTGPARAAALDGACTSCHGPRFTGMLTRWQAGLDWRTRAVSAYVSRAVADRRLAATVRARAQVRSAQQALLLVNAGGAVHNVRGSDALFRAAVDSVASAYAETGVPAPVRPSLGPDPARTSCVGCHYGIETARDSVFGQAFDHGAHVLRGAVQCRQCHSAADYLLPGTHDVDKRHGRTMLAAAACSGCHHDERSTVACAHCHTGDTRLARGLPVALPLRLRPLDAPTNRTVSFEHGVHRDVDCASCHTARPNVTTVTGCATCHDTHHRNMARCSSCHGSDMHSAHKAADHLACANCHNRETVALLTPDRTFCVSCHADRSDHKSGRQCSTCHMQSTPPELRKRILGGRP